MFLGIKNPLIQVRDHIPIAIGIRTVGLYWVILAQ